MTNCHYQCNWLDRHILARLMTQVSATGSISLPSALHSILTLYQIDATPVIISRISSCCNLISIAKRGYQIWPPGVPFASNVTPCNTGLHQIRKTFNCHLLLSAFTTIANVHQRKQQYSSSSSRTTHWCIRCRLCRICWNARGICPHPRPWFQQEVIAFRITRLLQANWIPRQ